MKAGRTKKPPRLCKVYHSSRPCATNGSKSHLPAQVKRKFKLHICAMKSCVCGAYAVYCCREESNQNFPLSARNAEILERNGAVYRKAKNSCNMKTAYLRYAIQRCCCCIKKLNCYICIRCRNVKALVKTPQKTGKKVQRRKKSKKHVKKACKVGGDVVLYLSAKR